MRNVAVGNRLRLEVGAAERGAGRSAARGFRDVACAGRIPIPRSQPGTCWDLFAITPCNWGGGRGAAGEQRALFLVLFVIEPHGW